MAVLCLVTIYVHLVNYSSRFDLREKLVEKSGKIDSKYTVYIFSVNCFELIAIVDSMLLIKPLYNLYIQTEYQANKLELVTSTYSSV